MSLQSNTAAAAATTTGLFAPKSSAYWSCSGYKHKNELRLSRKIGSVGVVYCSSSNNATNNNNSNKKGVPNSNYVVPMDKSFSSTNSSYITRPLVEILRDLNKRIPDNITNPPNSSSTFISWYFIFIYFNFMMNSVFWSDLFRFLY